MPLSTDQIRQDAQRYTQEADSYLRNKYPDLFPPGRDISNFGHNDSIDAFRHSYVSGRFAQEYGPVQFFLFGAYHELTHWNDGPERHMDFWNNSKGIEYSKDAKTPKDLGDRIDRGIKDGELITEPKLSPAPPFEGDPFTGMPWPGGDPGDWDDAEHTVSPLVLDLDGDGVETTQISRSMTSGTHFNLDARGLSENTGWAGRDDGLLVRDLNGDGKITSGRELFGNHTLLKNGAEAANGFEALRDLDDNADGLIDSQDAAFASLRVWKDANGDGITDAGELLTLDAAGVRNLKVAYTAGGTDAQGNAVLDAQGNAHSQLGGYTKTDGSTQQMDDVWFAVDTVRSVNRDPVAVSDAIAALPDLAGMGNLRSLHQAMARGGNYLNAANDKDWRAAA